MSIEEMGYFTDRAVRSDRVIYTPTLFAKEALLYLQEVGSLQALKPHQSHRESLDSFLFFVVKNGRGELQFRFLWGTVCLLIADIRITIEVLRMIHGL